MTAADYFLYFGIFVIGIVIGRITMAIQYALMKSAAKKKKS